MSALVGIDGCRGGWIAVSQSQGQLAVELWPDLDPLFSRQWRVACLDIPIGLLGSGRRRPCDVEARKLLGKRRSSLFYAPSRDWIQALDYQQVRTQGVSLQTFYLLPKVREIDQRIDVHHQSFVHEAHPELAFWARCQHEELLSKKTAAGRRQREEILKRVGSPFALATWSARFKRSDVALDDLLDAAILLEVARSGERAEGAVTGGGERDSRGLKMEIWY